METEDPVPDKVSIPDLISSLQAGKAETNVAIFVQKANIYNATLEGQDVVQEYLLQSGQCDELLEFVDFQNKKSFTEIALVFKMLEQILLRISDDLHNYASLGSYVVQNVMSSRTKAKTIYWMLSRKKSIAIKATLCLLTSMVTLGSQVAKEVLASFNFSHSSINYVLARTDINSPEDVRTCYIRFILAFLVIDDNQIIRQVVDQKGLLNAVFHRLKNDKADTIQLFLSTLLSKVVQNSSLPKTSKVRLLNDFSLKQVLELYCWEAPTRILSKSKKSTSKDDKKENKLVNISQGEDKKLTEEQVEVREVAHQFLLAVCCSRKQGILFLDTSIGTSGRNCNHLITGLLTAVDKPHASPYTRELVSKVLAVSPDQLRFYVPTLQHFVAPRLSSQWISSMKFMQEIYENQNPVETLKGLTAKVPVNKLVTMVFIMTLPTVVSQTVFTDALKHKNLVVRHVALEALSSSLKRIAHCIQPSVTAELVNINALSSDDIPEFISRMSRLFNKVLPEWDLIKECWTKAISGLEGHPSEDEAKVGEEELPDPSVLIDPPNITLTTHLLLVLEIQLELCQLFPELKRNLTLDMPQLLATLHEANKLTETSSEIDTFHVKVAQLVVKSGELKSLLVNKIFAAPLVHGLSHAICHSRDSDAIRLARNGLIKLLCELNLADYAEEMHLWVFHLTTDEPADQCFNLVMDKFLQNKKRLSRKIKEIQSSNNSSACMFSPLLVAAVETLNEPSNCDMNKDFICSVLKAALHLQEDHQALMNFLLPYHSCISKRLLRYIDVCHGEKRPSKRKRCSLIVSELDLGDLLQEVFELRHQEQLEHQKCFDKKHLMTLVARLSQDSLFLLARQCSFYLKVTLSEELPLKKDLVKFWCRSLYLLVQRDVDNLSITEKNDEVIKPVDGLLLPVHVLLLRQPVILNWFLGEAADQRISQTTTRLVSDIFSLVRKSSTSTKDVVGLLHMYHQRLISILTKRLKRSQNGPLEMVNIDSRVLDVFRDCFKANELTSLLEMSSNGTQFLNSSIYLFCLEMLVDLVLKDRTPYISGAWLVQIVCGLADDDSLLFVILRLVRGYPLYAAILPSDFVEFCFRISLVRSNCLLSEIVAIAMSVNCASFQRFIECSLSIAVTAQSLPALLPLAVAFTDQVYCSKEEPSCDLYVDEILTVTKNIFQIYFSYMIEVLQDNETEISSSTIQDLCYLLRVWKRMDYIDADSAVKLLVSNATPLLWDQILLRGGTNFRSLLRELIPSLRKPSRMAHVCLHVLSEAFMKAPWTKSEAIQELIGLCITCINSVTTSNPQKVLTHKSVATPWNSLAKQLLKNGLGGENRADCLELLSITYSKFYSSEQNGLGLSASNLFALVFSHSNFLNIMLAGDNSDSVRKGKLLDLLLVISSLDSSVCKFSHVAVFLGSYGATLKANDQKLLQLLSIYEGHGCKLQEYRPYVWGPAAVTHYAIKTKMDPSLNKESRMEDILALVDKDKVILTSLGFPLDLALEPTVTQFENGDLYDPRFMLPLVCQLLQPENVIHCMRFLESGLLALAFASLSSSCCNMRSAGYRVLFLFWEQVEGSRFSNKQLWLHLLDCLKNAVAEPNDRLYSMITTFLVRLSTLLLTPEDPLYAPVCAFIIRKPVLDVKHIPEFLKLFNSSDLQYRKHRQWILDLISDGLRQSEDFYLCLKSHAFKLILTYSISPLCDGSSLLQVLELCCSAAKIPSKAIKLVQQHGILSYLHGLWFRRQSFTEIFPASIKLVNILWKNVVDSPLEQDNVDAAVPETSLTPKDNKSSTVVNGHNTPLVFAEFFVTLQALLDQLSDVNMSSWVLYLDTLSSVSRHLHIQSEHSSERKTWTAFPHLADHQVMKLLVIHKKILPAEVTESSELSASVGNSKNSKDVIDDNKIQTSASRCEENLLQILLCWCEQRANQRAKQRNEDNARITRCKKSDFSISGPDMSETTEGLSESAYTKVLHYVIQNLSFKRDTSALYVQLLKCLVLELSSTEPDCAVTNLFVGPTQSFQNLAHMFDIYNHCHRCTSVTSAKGEKPWSDRTSLAAMLNTVFLKLFCYMDTNVDSYKTLSNYEFKSSRDILVPALKSKSGKQTFTEMLEVEQASQCLNGSEKVTAIRNVSQFVANVILRRTQQSQESAKRRHSGSPDFKKRKKMCVKISKH